ncbi:protein HEG homolog 1 isoform X1 [Melanerpes formicivorus]|uniref:protein HEG homolog 1 isoform X1 n=1 Tax=Melanerpes formicivorus TaxID=211600 RepID=UPI00358F335F
MPAACTLLLLLGLVPPAGSLPLASPRRLPPRPPPSSRSRLGRPCSPPAAGHAGSPVIESTRQARRSDMEMGTSAALVDGVELVTMMARNGEQTLLPASHGAVLAAGEVTMRVGPLSGHRDATPPGAGPSGSPSAGITTHLPTHNHPPAEGSHHCAVGCRERDKRALASPSPPATTERTPLVLAAISTDSAERTLGRHHGGWDVVEFDSTTRTGVPPSSAETRHPAIGSSYQPSSVLATERRVSDFPTTSTSISTTATKGGERTLRSVPASARLADAAEISTSGTEITSSSDQSQSSSGAQGGGGRGATVPILTGSPSASESASTTFSSRYEPKSIPAAEEVTLYLDTHGGGTPSVAAGAEVFPANSHTARLTRSSATRTNPTRSLGSTFSLGARTHHLNSPQEATDLPTPPGEPSLTSSLSPFENTSRGVRSSHRPVNSSTTEKTPLASFPTSTLIAAKASSRRPPRFATGSSGWAAEASTSSSGIYKTLGTIQSLSTSSVRETSGVHRPREIMDFTEQVADPLLTRSDSPSEGPSRATGSSHVSFSILSTERRTNYPTTGASISMTATKGGGRTLRSLPASTKLTQTTEISTTATKTISSPDHTWSSSGAHSGGGRGATVLFTGSPPASESASPAERTSAMGGHLPDVTSTPSSVVATSGGERSTVPISDAHAAFSTAESSSPAPFHTSSLYGVLLLSSSATEPGRQSHISQSGAGLGELSTKPLPAFSPSISVPSPSPSASVPEGGRRVSGAPAETTDISTTLSSHKKGASQPAVNHGVWSTAAENLTSYPDTAREPHTGLLLSSTAWPGAGHLSPSQAGYPEPKFNLSSKVSTYFSAASEPSTMGRIHHSLSSQNAEEGMSSPVTDPVYNSSTSAGSGARTLHSVMGSTLADGTESSVSLAEATDAPRLAQAASEEQSRTVHTSTSSGGFAGFVTETLFTRSSKIPTHSSFQSDLTSLSSSHQPVSGIDAEKRTSASHTDGTYISTTYTRGGERTLLSISNSSISADSSESSTFFSEISSLSDASKSPVDKRSNVSSDGSFVEPSTEPLVVHSSKLLTSASADGIQNTTVFGTDSELLTTGRSSLSTSAFPASSSLSSLHHSLSSTPPPLMFTTSESSEPLSSSVTASSPPLQALSSSSPTSSLLSPSYSLVSLLPLFSSPSSISQSNDSDQASTPVATTVARRVPSTAAVAGSSPRGTKKHSVTHQPQNRTIFTSTESPFPTAPMEQLGGHVVTVSAPTVVMETALPRAATAQGDSSRKTVPLLTTASDTPWAGPTDTPISPSPAATNHSVVVPAVALTTVKPSVLTTLATTPSDATTMKAHRAETPAATKHVYTTGESTEAVGTTAAGPGKVTEESIPVTSPSKTLAPSKTTVSIATTLAGTKPTTISPPSSTTGLRMSSPGTDVDKCLSNPCPALATCNNTHGSYVCQCPLGYELEKGKCNLVRIFMGQVPLKLNITHGKYAELPHVEDEILTMLNASLSGLPGYHHSTVKATREANFVHVSVQSTFSLASNVTFYDVVSTVRSYIRACKSPTDVCQFISSLKPLHRVGSLCKQKDPECDKETSDCTDFNGVALCQCKSGYFKYNKMDHSCRACEDGYKLENETCVSCPFGLGGFNCGNPYQLITVVIAAAGGGLLLIMGIALIVTCCRKNKNDISKLIFKSGDFQMSPYAEYPKNPRAQEWGRETIEMQENGSTKNLLQMTDVYYSPTGLRNPELERNGLYPPYTGLPGSRHSCIYPGQYNPSFISDETRRRDYF